uniref:Uncharacterized protein n=1 Tax=Rhizophora mucronata TaxID=61149 RepID=A0A2P2Q9F2_RHIMU
MAALWGNQVINSYKNGILIPLHREREST